MKKVLAFVIVMRVAVGAANAQETMVEAVSEKGNEWRYAFSKEGRENWKPEFTFRLQAGLITSGPMLTGGVRVDEKRSLHLLLGQGDTYIDHAPGDLQSVRAGVAFRRYWHLGKRKAVAFYSDLYAGAACIYEVNGKYRYNKETGEKKEIIDDNVGDMRFIGGWQPGFRVRFYKNIHLFLGPTIATDCIGIHLGVGL